VRRAALKTELGDKLAVKAMGEEAPEEGVGCKEHDENSSPNFHLLSGGRNFFLNESGERGTGLDLIPESVEHLDATPPAHFSLGDL
jgi:hypothetical protein